MRALEKRKEISSAIASWRKAFELGAEAVGTMSGAPVYWHDRLGIWGMFGKTAGKHSLERGWNGFGQKPNNFRSNIIVEINAPSQGIDRNLQAVFATDKNGGIWLLHQGRMSVSGSRVTEADFIAATGLKPTKVQFSDGSYGEYHKITCLDEPAPAIQQNMAAFVAQCARARLAKVAKGAPVAALSKVQDWERGLTPELTGGFNFGPRAGGTGRRHHAEIWRALVSELEQRGILHSNDRVEQYGPDLFTYGTSPKVLFEIKSSCTAQDVFAGVGQLHIYDRLLGGGYRKVLVAPKGIRKALHGPLLSLAVDTVEFDRAGRKIIFDSPSLSKCLK